MSHKSHDGAEEGTVKEPVIFGNFFCISGRRRPPSLLKCDGLCLALGLGFRGWGFRLKGFRVQGLVEKFMVCGVGRTCNIGALITNYLYYFGGFLAIISV